MKLNVPRSFAKRYIDNYLEKKRALGESESRASAICLQFTNRLLTLPLDNEKRIVRKLEVGGQAKWEELGKRGEFCKIERFFPKGNKINVLLTVSHLFSTHKGSEGKLVFLEDMLFLYKKQIDVLNQFSDIEFSKTAEIKQIPDYAIDSEDEVDLYSSAVSFSWKDIFPDAPIIREIKNQIKITYENEEDPYQFFALDQITEALLKNEIDDEIRLLWGPPGTGKTSVVRLSTDTTYLLSCTSKFIHIQINISRCAVFGIYAKWILYMTKEPSLSSNTAKTIIEQSTIRLYVIPLTSALSNSVFW